MNRRLSAQARKSIGDILRRKAHSIVIVLAILIPVGGFTAVSVAGDSLASAYAFSVGTHGSSQDTVLAVDRTDPALLAAIARLHNVAAAQVATMVQTQWHVAAAPGHVAFTIVGYPDPSHVPLTPFQLLAGRYPGTGEIVMEYGDKGLQPSASATASRWTPHGAQFPCAWSASPAPRAPTPRPLAAAAAT